MPELKDELNDIKIAWYKRRPAVITMVATVLGGLQACWFALSDSVSQSVYIGGAIIIPLLMQVINICYGKMIAKYKASQEDSTDV